MRWSVACPARLRPQGTPCEGMRRLPKNTIFRIGGYNVRVTSVPSFISFANSPHSPPPSSPPQTPQFGPVRPKNKRPKPSLKHDLCRYMGNPAPLPNLNHFPSPPSKAANPKEALSFAEAFLSPREKLEKTGHSVGMFAPHLTRPKKK